MNIKDFGDEFSCTPYRIKVDNLLDIEILREIIFFVSIGLHVRSKAIKNSPVIISWNKKNISKL